MLAEVRGLEAVERIKADLMRLARLRRATKGWGLASISLNPSSAFARAWRTKNSQGVSG